MNSFNQNSEIRDYTNLGAAQTTASAASRKFLLNTYNWMAMGLAVTGLIAYAVAGSETILKIIFQNIFLFYFIVILQLITVIALSAAIKKIPAILAIAGFFFYSVLTGLTFSILFLVYTSSSIFYTFFICAAMFASVSVFGYITKTDLSRFGSFLFMALIGLIIASVVNIFLHSTMIYWITTYAGVIIFVGLTAYDTQKIKEMSRTADYETEEGKKYSVIAALNLYLDFINLFLFLLRILGQRK
jgi:FtsH-binding integral membrane protein